MSTGLLGGVFWREALDRAAKSAAQALLITLGGDAAFDVFSVDWRVIVGVSGGAAVLSLLTSIASAPFGQKGTASVL